MRLFCEPYGKPIWLSAISEIGGVGVEQPHGRPPTARRCSVMFARAPSCMFAGAESLTTEAPPVTSG